MHLPANQGSYVDVAHPLTTTGPREVIGRGLKILLISSGEFSGVKPALMLALQRAGCEVIAVRESLREFGLLRYWHGLRMMVSALVVYGSTARNMIERTRTAYTARSLACKAAVDKNPDVDVVLLIGANSSNYWGERPAHIKFVVYTDYMNLLSKALPDYGLAIEEKTTYPLWNSLERHALLTQDHIFVMGSHVKPAVEAAYGISPEKITVVGAGPGLDLDIERDGYVKDYTSQSILFVGKLAQKKGLGVLLQAFVHVRKVFPDATLHVVTGETVAAEGVVFHGKTSLAELKQLFYASSIFTMPAFKEPLGLVFLEAMWSKCACVGTTTGSMPELIRDGETGYVVEPGDAVQLAERIIALLSDPEKLRDMGERAYVAAAAYWQWDLVAQRILNVLHEHK